VETFNNFKDGVIIKDNDLALDVLGVIKTYSGSAPVEVETDYVSTVVPTMGQVDKIIDNLPIDLDFDVMVHSDTGDFPAHIVTTSDGGDEQEDTEYDMDNTNVPKTGVSFELIIYTYNTSEDVIDEPLDEVKRRIKINARGQRRIKMQCKKGFKFDGKKCVKISGGELVNKRRAIRKSLRTKKAKGSGFQRRVARLRNRANKKRKGMGVRNFVK